MAGRLPTYKNKLWVVDLISVNWPDTRPSLALSPFLITLQLEYSLKTLTVFYDIVCDIGVISSSEGYCRDDWFVLQ